MGGEFKARDLISAFDKGTVRAYNGDYYHIISQKLKRHIVIDCICDKPGHVPEKYQKLIEELTKCYEYNNYARYILMEFPLRLLWTHFAGVYEHDEGYIDDDGNFITIGEETQALYNHMLKRKKKIEDTYKKKIEKKNYKKQLENCKSDPEKVYEVKDDMVRTTNEMEKDLYDLWMEYRRKEVYMCDQEDTGRDVIKVYDTVLKMLASKEYKFLEGKEPYEELKTLVKTLKGEHTDSRSQTAREDRRLLDFFDECLKKKQANETRIEEIQKELKDTEKRRELPECFSEIYTSEAPIEVTDPDHRVSEKFRYYRVRLTDQTTEFMQQMINDSGTAFLPIGSDGRTTDGSDSSSSGDNGSGSATSNGGSATPGSGTYTDPKKMGSYIDDVSYLKYKYWLRHFALDTIFGIPNLVTWFSKPLIKLPVVYVPIVVFHIKDIILVVGVGIAGLGTYPCCLVLNMSDRDTSYIVPLVFALEKVYSFGKTKIDYMKYLLQ